MLQVVQELAASRKTGFQVVAMLPKATYHLQMSYIYLNLAEEDLIDDICFLAQTPVTAKSSSSISSVASSE